MKKFLVLLSVGVFMFLNTQTGYTQSSSEIEAIQKDIEILKEGQKSIQKDLDDLKKMMQAAPRQPQQAEFKEAVINIEDDPFKGDKNAMVTLVEFTDYQ